MLEEIEMPPSHLVGVVGWTVRRAAAWTSKGAARGKVDLDVRPARLSVEVAAAHCPGRRQAQHQL